MSRKNLVWTILIAFFVGAIGSIVLGRFLIPYLGNIKGWSFLNKFATNSPIVVNHTQEVQLNEGVNLIDLIKNSGNGVVAIYGPTNNFLSNGIIMTSDGLIFASASGIDGQTQLTVVTNDGQKFPATIKDKAKNGLVALTITANGLPSIQLNNAANLAPGQRVIYLGRSNLKFEHMALSGFVTESLANQLSSPQVLSDVNFTADYFGGPIVNLAGNTVALVINNSENLTAEELGTALNKFLTTGKLE